MPLTSAECSTIKADLTGASAAAFAAFVAAAPSGDAGTDVANFYNATAAGAAKVWREDAPVDAVRGAILWNRFTPSDAVPSDLTQLDILGQLARWQARSLACQGKQFNLQLMLSGTASGTVPGHLKGFRDGLQDACASIPSGTGGATQNGGWTTTGTPVQEALKRAGTRLELLLSTTDGTAQVSSRYNYGVTRDDGQAILAAA